MVNFYAPSLFYFSDIFGSFWTTEHGAGAVNSTPAATSTAPPARPLGCLATGPRSRHTPLQGAPYRAPITTETT